MTEKVKMFLLAPKHKQGKGGTHKATAGMMREGRKLTESPEGSRMGD